MACVLTRVGHVSGHVICLWLMWVTKNYYSNLSHVSVTDYMVIVWGRHWMPPPYWSAQIWTPTEKGLKYKLVLFQDGEIVGGHQSVLSLCQPQMFAKLLSLLPCSGLSSLEMVTIFLPDWQHLFVSSLGLYSEEVVIEYIDSHSSAHVKVQMSRNLACFLN